ncbi:MAG TPA: hypothetical protein VK509_21265 [Polyangiales bacterium]|nr:hypothetical protein [Polyangiales bacterium]
MVLAMVVVAGSARPAAAEEELAFTLDEVEAATTPKVEPEAKTQSKTKGAPIANALGELRWGMSKDALLSLMKKRIRADYTTRIRAEKDIMRQDALYNEANAVFRRIKDGYVEFNGRKTGWDASAVAEEFTHGSGEAMLVVDDPSARDLYFFIHGRLWKWYRELKPASMGGGDFDSISEVLKDQFGATSERNEPRSEQGAAYRMLTWADDHTRLSAIRRGGESCLVFEESATLERLAMLRESATPRGQKRGGVLDGVIMTTAQREAWRDSH